MGQPRPGGRARTVDDRGQGPLPCPGPGDDDHGFGAVLAMVNLTLNELDRQLTISHIGAGVAAVLAHAGVGIVVAPR